MEQKDYLLRLVEQFTRILGKALFDLIGLKNKGKISDSIDTTIQSLINELNIDLYKLTSIKNDELIDTLNSKKGFNNENMGILAEILMQAGYNFDKMDNLHKRESFFQTCLTIYEYLEKSDKTYSFERKQKINELKILLNS